MESGTTRSTGSVDISDPWGIAEDASLAHASSALDPDTVEWAFAVAKHSCEDLSANRLQAVRVTRHKPGKRCVIEYDLVSTDNAVETTLIGKIRRKRSGRTAFELSREFYMKGFDGEAVDGIAVPEAVAYVKKLGLWLQRKVPGEEATQLLDTPAGVSLGKRIAEAAFKIHQAKVPTERQHGIEQELKILFNCLDIVSAARKPWHDRIERLKENAIRMSKTLDNGHSCGIHRDFYADQIIVDRDRLWLLDFDLYCIGDPALDLGNFIGHVTEQSLRVKGNPSALLAVEQALENRYVSLAGESIRSRIQVYALLTLMRHIYISTLHQDRQHTTEKILNLCEQRMDGMSKTP